ncbi:helix-turn-helix transcriptional regulator [Weissella coleopterorum]|uniref:Helix-turn-helix transcriptional regulator n=1 Tax=Weissella coleopterorum TaxID=2714949 RepID=A0A6G8AY25_9LACO|nr:helix-turn-helix transcriptional regulator [Weissella coleopterorum]QIL49880.1 helix-turn-helix transcriptional regulator [Weissella coleopterorum]
MNRIRRMRADNNISLEYLGLVVNESRATINNWELGKTEPNAEIWHKLAQYFDVTIGYLMGYEEEKDNFIYLNEVFSGIVRDMRKNPNADVMIVLEGKPIYNNAQGFVDAYLHPELVKITKL